MSEDIKITSGRKGTSLQPMLIFTNPRRQLLTNNIEYLAPAIELITKCFWDDPVIRFMLCSLSDERRATFYPPYTASLVKAAFYNDAVFDEGKDWSCVATWMPPEKRVDGTIGMLRAGLIPWFLKLGLDGIKRMLIDFQKQSDQCKKIGLRDADGKPIKQYHYLFFIATDPNARGQGLASKMIARYQKIATDDAMPIWLEATTKHSRDIYERLGFEEVKEMRLGKGTHAAGGFYEKGGPGVSVWSMIWWPENLKH